MNIDLVPINVFDQKCPDGTFDLLLKGSSKGYVDWAVKALMDGWEAPSLEVLAGLEYGLIGSYSDVYLYFNRCLRELKVEFPKNEAIFLRAYLFELVSQMASGQADVRETLDKIHKDIIYCLDHPYDLQPWCDLGCLRGHINEEELLVAYAKSWIKNGPAVFPSGYSLSEYNKVLDVTCSPNPVKAHLGGPNDKQYEWVFETKVRAIDKPVSIDKFGAFVWQRGRRTIATSTRDEYNDKDFATQFSCPDAILPPGESYSTLTTVSSVDLLGWKASLYFRKGMIVEGIASVDGLGKIEA